LLVYRPEGRQNIKGRQWVPFFPDDVLLALNKLRAIPKKFLV